MSVLLRYQQLIRKVCKKEADAQTAKQLNPIRGTCFFLWRGSGSHINWGWGGGSTINHHPSMHHPGMKRQCRRMPTEMSGWWASTIQQLIMHQVWKPHWEVLILWFIFNGLRGFDFITFLLSLNSSWSSSIIFLGSFEFIGMFFFASSGPGWSRSSCHVPSMEQPEDDLWQH